MAKVKDDFKQRLGEALATILQTVKGTFSTKEIAQQLADDLIERLAKQECKRHYDMPAWTKLNARQKRRLLKGAERTLISIRDFWNEKAS